MSTRELLTREVSGPVDVPFTKIVAECYTGPRLFFSSFSSSFGLDLMSQLFLFFDGSRKGVELYSAKENWMKLADVFQT